MQTLLLLGLGFLALGGSKPSTSTSSTSTSSAPPPTRAPTGADLATQFGAFVGAAIAAVIED